MSDFASMLVTDLREAITDKDDFKAKMGKTVSSARKSELVAYLSGEYTPAPSKAVQVKPRRIIRSNSETNLVDVLDNRPINSAPPKLDKNYEVDPSKLDKIREELPKAASPPEREVPDELCTGLDDDDRHMLGNILCGEVQESPGYEYHETSEIKCKKYAEIYPNIKPILSSPDFKSSREKLLYVEQHLASTRSALDITEMVYMATSFVESNKQVNNYLKLRGYTKKLKEQEVALRNYI